jgi:hypothetical protein
LQVKGIVLRGPGDDEKKMKDVLTKELAKTVIPGTKFVVRLDEVEFRQTPIYVLQEAAVAEFKANSTFNVFFERATFGADGALQLHTLCLRFDKSTNSKIDKLLADHPVAGDLVGGKDKTPRVLRRDWNWEDALVDLRRKFAGDADLLLQRTRLDDGYLAYVGDAKSVQFVAWGACIHPPGLIADAERVKRWKARLSNLIPKVKYEPDVAGVLMLANPSIAWQDLAASAQANDGTFFHLARFNAEGQVTLDVKIPHDLRKQSALQIIADKAPHIRLTPIDVKNANVQVWAWDGVHAKAQARLAEGAFLQHRTRVDRLFMKYDEPDNGTPFLHAGGVCLHPTETQKPEELRSKLSASFGNLLPTPLEYRTNATSIRFLASPIYPLQAEAVTRKLDGLLFADGRYDADGKFHLAVVGTKDQRTAASKMIAALPMPEGVIRPRAGTVQPITDFKEHAWDEILQETQRWMARSTDTLFRKTRLDRGYFSYPASKVGPNLNLAFVGIYPNSEALTARLTKRFDTYAELSLTDHLLAGPIAVVPTIENVENPIVAVQAKVAETPSLDGVRLDDASFDADGKLNLHGIWVGKVQQDSLEKKMRDVLTPGNSLLRRGFNWGPMQVFDSPALLHQMRVWVAEQQDVDEVWLERFYFDANGKVRIAGFSTRPPDKDKTEKKLPDMLPRFDSKKLPPIDRLDKPKAEKITTEITETTESDLGVVGNSKVHHSVISVFSVVNLLQPKDDGPIVLDALTNIGQHLRNNIPKDVMCDGLRIDRCYYNPAGVFHIDGLADRDGHTQELKPFLEEGVLPFNAKRQLAKGWVPGRQVVIPIRPMMTALAENMPSLTEFDGLTLTRAYHDSKNRLVLTATAIGKPDVDAATESLKRLLDTHPRWRLRLTSGLVLDVTDQKPADRELAQKLTTRALLLLQVNIGEARVDPVALAWAPWLSHSWPFYEKLPRVKPSDDDYAEALRHLNAAIPHDPGNNLAWYLRGYVLQASGRSDLTLRDLRRMVALEIADAELRHRRVLDLELVQGRLRQSAYQIERRAVIDHAEGWTLRELK